MFCGLKGATDTPRRASARHSPATTVLLPASEVVPWIISVAMRIAAPRCWSMPVPLKGHYGTTCHTPDGGPDANRTGNLS
ncbi:hypothetical protein HPA02_16630 [Bisbaumannia pacifica]|uniref:Uncharacterized protein n=1 Tax=Bisbaumannia pacifica TaxID=77098 RepID=A0A510XFU4_9GAMM|nr:hypothetical protein HPA02_16630 [Halomonas pacifica]